MGSRLGAVTEKNKLMEIEKLVNAIRSKYVKEDGGPGSGPPLGNQNARKNFSDEEKESSGKAEHKISDELKPSYMGYSNGRNVEEFIENNVSGDNPEAQAELEKVFEDGGGEIEAIENEYYKYRIASTTNNLSDIGGENAENILAANISDNVYRGWMREANSQYKPKLAAEMTENSEVRNAALNVMYDNYKYFNGEKSKSYDEWLTTPVEVYRGTHGQESISSDVFSSYTFDKSVAEKFAGSNGTTQTATIRPIDTYGSLTRNGEAEIMVPSQLAVNKKK